MTTAHGPQSKRSKVANEAGTPKKMEQSLQEDERGER